MFFKKRFLALIMLCFGFLVWVAPSDAQTGIQAWDYVTEASCSQAGYKWCQDSSGYAWCSELSVECPAYDEVSCASQGGQWCGTWCATGGAVCPAAAGPNDQANCTANGGNWCSDPQGYAGWCSYGTACPPNDEASCTAIGANWCPDPYSNHGWCAVDTGYCPANDEANCVSQGGQWCGTWCATGGYTCQGSGTGSGTGTGTGTNTSGDQQITCTNSGGKWCLNSDGYSGWCSYGSEPCPPHDNASCVAIGGQWCGTWCATDGAFCPNTGTNPGTNTGNDETSCMTNAGKWCLNSDGYSGWCSYSNEPCPPHNEPNCIAQGGQWCGTWCAINGAVCPNSGGNNQTSCVNDGGKWCTNSDGYTGWCTFGIEPCPPNDEASCLALGAHWCADPYSDSYWCAIDTGKCPPHDEQNCLSEGGTWCPPDPYYPHSWCALGGITCGTNPDVPPTTTPTDKVSCGNAGKYWCVNSDTGVTWCADNPCPIQPINKEAACIAIGQKWCTSGSEGWCAPDCAQQQINTEADCVTAGKRWCVSGTSAWCTATAAETCPSENEESKCFNNNGKWCLNSDGYSGWCSYGSEACPAHDPASCNVQGGNWCEPELGYGGGWCAIGGSTCPIYNEEACINAGRNWCMNPLALAFSPINTGWCTNTADEVCPAHDEPSCKAQNGDWCGTWCATGSAVCPNIEDDKTRCANEKGKWCPNADGYSGWCSYGNEPCPANDEPTCNAQGGEWCTPDNGSYLVAGWCAIGGGSCPINDEATCVEKGRNWCKDLYSNKGWCTYRADEQCPANDESSCDAQGGEWCPPGPNEFGYGWCATGGAICPINDEVTCKNKGGDWCGSWCATGGAICPNVENEQDKCKESNGKWCKNSDGFSGWCSYSSAACPAYDEPSCNLQGGDWCTPDNSSYVGGGWCATNGAICPINDETTCVAKGRNWCKDQYSNKGWCTYSSEEQCPAYDEPSCNAQGGDWCTPGPNEYGKGWCAQGGATCPINDEAACVAKGRNWCKDQYSNKGWCTYSAKEECPAFDEITCKKRGGDWCGDWCANNGAICPNYDREREDCTEHNGKWCKNPDGFSGWCSYNKSSCPPHDKPSCSVQGGEWCEPVTGTAAFGVGWCALGGESCPIQDEGLCIAQGRSWCKDPYGGIGWCTYDVNEKCPAYDRVTCQKQGSLWCDNFSGGTGWCMTGDNAICPDPLNIPPIVYDDTTITPYVDTRQKVYDAKIDTDRFLDMKRGLQHFSGNIERMRKDLELTEKHLASCGLTASEKAKLLLDKAQKISVKIKEANNAAALEDIRFAVDDISFEMQYFGDLLEPSYRVCDMIVGAEDEINELKRDAEELAKNKTDNNIDLTFEFTKLRETIRKLEGRLEEAKKIATLDPEKAMVILENEIFFHLEALFNVRGNIEFAQDIKRGLTEVERELQNYEDRINALDKRGKNVRRARALLKELQDIKSTLESEIEGGGLEAGRLDDLTSGVFEVQEELRFLLQHLDDNKGFDAFFEHKEEDFKIIQLPKGFLSNLYLPGEEIVPAAEEVKDKQIKEIEDISVQLSENKIDAILAEIKELRNEVKEQEAEIKYLKAFTSDLEVLSKDVEEQLNTFITYGVDKNTKHLGAGERAAVVHSYNVAFNGLPDSDKALKDMIKIANGRFPSARSPYAEKEAREIFREIYKRVPNLENSNDLAAVMVMAYGLRQIPENRNLHSERAGIGIYENIFDHHPSTTVHWNIMQAITYSGAIRKPDRDKDFLSDEDELIVGTNPDLRDTDDDGIDDGLEIENGFDPLQ